MLWLLLVFVVLPLVEVTLLLWMGSWVGPLPTFLLVLLTGVLGGSMARREGLAVLRRIVEASSRGVPPGDQLVEGALIAAGGLLLVTPGVLTDLAGLAMVLPPTRRRLAPAVLRALHRALPESSVVVGADGVFTTFGSGPPPDARGRPAGTRPPTRATPPGQASPFDHPVAESGRE